MFTSLFHIGPSAVNLISKTTRTLLLDRCTFRTLYPALITTVPDLPAAILPTRAVGLLRYYYQLSWVPIIQYPRV